MTRAIIVLEFEIDEPEDVTGILTAIDPPRLPKFSGAARISVGMPAARVIEYLEGASDTGPSGAPVPEVDHAALHRLERLTRDFDHYANHGDPADGADTFFRMIHGHLSSVLLLANGTLPLAEVVSELESHDRAIANDAIGAGITSQVGQRRGPRPPAKPGSAFGL